ncbi:hypothetical protein QP883_08360, partial [Winkia sp. UMB6473-AN360BR]
KGNPNQKNKKDQTQPKQLRKAHTQKEQKQKHTIENKNNHTTPTQKPRSGAVSNRLITGATRNTLGRIATQMQTNLR